jgi:putative tryptophan/tyrosine transport system substrate-binding protein
LIPDGVLGVGEAMRRREFIKLLGNTVVAWPLTAQAQQAAIPVIGFLGGADPVGYAPQIEAWRLGLRDQSYVEGQNIAVEYRWAEGSYDRLPALAADLVRRKVAVIVTQGTPAAFAAKQATTTIPIVMAIAGNPVVLWAINGHCAAHQERLACSVASIAILVESPWH